MAFSFLHRRSFTVEKHYCREFFAGNISCVSLPIIGTRKHLKPTGFLSFFLSFFFGKNELFLQLISNKRMKSKDNKEK